MSPLGHLVVAVVPVGGYLVWQDRRLPGLRTLFVIGVGSRFPDLIDEPLAYPLFLLPNGRVGVHSLPIAVPIAVIALYVARKLNRRRAGAAFVVAYGARPLADYYVVLLAPDPRLPKGLLWPLVPVVPGRLEPRWVGPDSLNVKLWALFSAVVLAVGLFRLWSVYRSESSDDSR